MYKDNENKWLFSHFTAYYIRVQLYHIKNVKYIGNNAKIIFYQVLSIIAYCS